MSKLTFALSRGRILEETLPMFEKIGLPVKNLYNPGRQLIFDEGDFRFFIIRPTDVPTFIEYGTADIGIVGKDTIMEGDYNLFDVLDIKIGVCRMSVAMPVDKKLPENGIIRIATKYPGIAENYFASKGRQIEIIKLYGSMEIAPIVGIADAIVDVVATGKTLKENGLKEIEIIDNYVSSHLVVNRGSFYDKNEEISNILFQLEKLIND